LDTPPVPARAPPDPPGVVALTFDDGPDPRWTPRILRELADAQAHATFFVIAPRAAAHPHLIDAIISQGHEIGLHCARHLRHTQTPRPIIEEDTLDALRTLRSLDVRPTRWRLPWGAAATWSPAVADAHRLSIVGWTADTHDWRGDSAAAMLDSVDPLIADHAVVLMHDGLGPGALRDGCLQTARLVAPLAHAIRARGCQPASLRAMMETSASR
jgi:peptidoglycan/xylan/chitin deacetylase (PgdA/CDA1 family)